MKWDPNNWRVAVQENVECEGFFPAMVHYEDYDWIEDPEFHSKLQQLKIATQRLAEYVGVDSEI